MTELIIPPPDPIEFPQDPKKLRERIRRYERAMRQEQERTGMISDGYGKRFLLGPMYMLLGDLEGAIRHFTWYESECGFRGDCYQLMCWTLALLRSGSEKKARYIFKVTMLTNLYQIPALLGIKVKHKQIWHGSNTEDPSWLNCVPPELYELWQADELAWARQLWYSEEIIAIREEYIELSRRLLTLPRGPERSAAIRKLDAMHDAPLAGQPDWLKAIPKNEQGNGPAIKLPAAMTNIDVEAQLEATVAIAQKFQQNDNDKHRAKALVAISSGAFIVQLSPKSRRTKMLDTILDELQAKSVIGRLEMHKLLLDMMVVWQREYPGFFRNQQDAEEA